MATETAREVVLVLKRLGFQEHRQVGSHLTMLLRSDGKRITVPMDQGDLPTGTFHRILKEAGITVDEFLRSQRSGQRRRRLQYGSDTYDNGNYHPIALCSVSD